MELRRYAAIIRRRLALVVLTTIAGLIGGYLTAPRVATYSAQSTIYVGAQLLNERATGAVSADVLSGLQQVSATFAQMIKSAPIAEAALDRTRLQRPVQSVIAETETTPEPNTQLLRVKVTDSNPAVAQALANGMADGFVEKIGTFEPSGAPQPGEVPRLPAYVFERAGLPTSPVPVGMARRVILGGLFGFIVAVAIAFLLEYLDITIKSAADAERRLELPVLAVIPFGRESMPARQRRVRTPARTG
jgi:receptor protein-tyrosine kinase